MNTATCEVCGVTTPSLLETMPFDCIGCGGTATMKASVNRMLLPFSHNNFKRECDCPQCYVYFRREGTVTQIETVMDGSEVELLCDYGKGKHNAMVDYLVSIGPEKMFFITGLIHTHETLTFAGWAQRIREVGVRLADDHLTVEEIEELAKGVESI